MSEQTAQEPTMEEILASIRRIISEDDAPPADAAPAEPAFAPAPVEPEDEDVLELTDAIEAAAPIETHGDIDVFEPSAPEPEPAAWAPEPEPMPSFDPPAPEPEPAFASRQIEEEPILSAATAAATASAFGRLEAALAMPSPSQTLDGVVRELLKPLLKDWLDQNLPRIVEAKVAEAVEKLQRGRV